VSDELAVYKNREVSSDAILLAVVKLLPEKVDDLYKLVESEIKRLEDSDEAMKNSLHFQLEAIEKATSLLSGKTEAQFLGIRDTQQLAKESLQRQFDSIDDATKIATQALDKRLESMNEFRGQLNDWRADTMTRPEITTQLNAMVERMSSLEQFSNNMQGRVLAIETRRTGDVETKKGMSDSMATIIAAIGAVAIVVGSIAAVVAIFHH
jgi:NAD-dependent DNA ligase